MKEYRMGSFGNRGKSAGFTLIELLTVIAIIGILAAILIPVVGAVRESARQAKCMSNMRQIGLGILMYEGELGVLPGPIFRRVVKPEGDVPDIRELNWIFDDYLEIRSEVWECPTNAQYMDPALNPGAVMFLLNNKLSTNPPQFFGYPGTGSMPIPIGQIVSAGRDPKSLRSSEPTMIWMISDVDGKNYSAAQIGTSNPEKPLDPNAPPVHNGSRNFVFFDGHAENRKESNFPPNP